MAGCNVTAPHRLDILNVKFRFQNSRLRSLLLPTKEIWNETWNAGFVPTCVARSHFTLPRLATKTHQIQQYSWGGVARFSPKYPGGAAPCRPPTGVRSLNMGISRAQKDFTAGRHKTIRPSRCWHSKFYKIKKIVL